MPFEYCVGNLRVARRSDLVAHQRLHRRRAQDAPRELDAAHQRVDVGLRAQVAAVEDDGRGRVGAAQLDAAARVRVQKARVDRQAVACGRVAADVADQRRQHVELHVGAARTVGVGKAAALDDVGREQPAAKREPLRAVHERAPAAILAEQADRFSRATVDRHFEVVLVVLADAGQVLDDADAHRLQRRAGADARQQQQLGRRERAGGEDHFAPRVHGRLGAAA